VTVSGPDSVVRGLDATVTIVDRVVSCLDAQVITHRLEVTSVARSVR
jgi:hypothetical protein